MTNAPETTTVTTTAPITNISEQSSTDNIYEGVDSYAQTGVSQISTYTQTSYSGHTKAASDEGEPTAEEEIPETVSSEGEVSEADTESVMETSSLTEQPVIAFTASRRRLLRLLLRLSVLSLRLRW